MSERYKAAMDKIAVSDELRKKVIASAVLKEGAPTPSPRRSHACGLYLRYAVTMAACLLICFSLALKVSKNKTTDYVALPIEYSQNNTVSAIEEAQKEVGYIFELPLFLPEGYFPAETSVFFGSLVEIKYSCEGNTILFRTEKTNDNISGNYNTYEKVETEAVNGKVVTLKSNGELYYNAVWQEENAYSLDVENGIDKETLLKIVEGVGPPRKRQHRH